MSPTAGSGRPRVREGLLGIRLAGCATLAVLILLAWFGARWTDRMREASFDILQTVTPRAVQTLPVTIVAIDQKSLLTLGQWPWPRTTLARLIDAIAVARPAAIGVNLLMPEPDALSPERLLAQTSLADPAVSVALAGLLSNDKRLATTLARYPIVLAVAGLPEATGRPLRAAPIAVRGGEGTGQLHRYEGALSSIDELNLQASGWGLVSVDPTRGIVRRIPLVASVGGTLMPTLAIELMRVAAQAPVLQLTMSHGSARSLSYGDRPLPTEADASVRPYFSPHLADRFVSAVDLLEGRADRASLRGQLVLIGLTGVGLDESLDTPLGERMSGSEIHAQLLENIVDGTLLRRPGWSALAEAGALALLGVLLIWAVPRWRPGPAALAAAAALLLPLTASIAAFRTERLLLDAATPVAGLVLLALVLLVLTLADSTRERRALKHIVQDEREQSARLSGELQAAQRIQTASLPDAALLRDDGRIDLHAALTPAREVGGDLYDYFMLDQRRLFLLIGDVAGKGLPASIFMTVSRALYKSAMLRRPDDDIGRIMTVANTEISRDNPQMLFVTVFAAILDLDTGTMNYCNAGHDNPLRLHPPVAVPEPVDDGDGPPLCALPDFVYQGAQLVLQPGEWLCMTTDGVTEARNPAGALYGTARLQGLLQRSVASGPDAAGLVGAVVDDVQRFADGAEAADDLTILVLRWKGPS